ncbi:MAG: hypothetical protein ABW198_05385 [Pseudorhodoplanes sp.]
MLLDLLQTTKQRLERIQPRMASMQKTLRVLQPGVERVAAFILFQIRQRTLDHGLALLQFAEHRLDHAAFLGDGAQLGAQRLLSLADFVDPALQIDCLVLTLLNRRLRFRLCDPLLQVVDGSGRVTPDQIAQGSVGTALILLCGRGLIAQAVHSFLQRVDSPGLLRNSVGLPDPGKQKKKKNSAGHNGRKLLFDRPLRDRADDLARRRPGILLEKNQHQDQERNAGNHQFPQLKILSCRTCRICPNDGKRAKAALMTQWPRAQKQLIVRSGWTWNRQKRMDLAMDLACSATTRFR